MGLVIFILFSTSSLYAGRGHYDGPSHTPKKSGEPKRAEGNDCGDVVEVCEVRELKDNDGLLKIVIGQDGNTYRMRPHECAKDEWAKIVVGAKLKIKQTVEIRQTIEVKVLC